MIEKHCKHCAHSTPHFCGPKMDKVRMHTRICTNHKASCRGVPSAGGGTWHGDVVSDTFGCVYFKGKQVEGGGA